jgi:5-methylcytosine-specific restriction endonuclease McrA
VRLNSKPNPLTILIAERDGYTCHLCGQPVDMAERHPLPMAPTLDHVLPASKGGKFEWDNLKLAHNLCNNRRGDRAEIPAIGSCPKLP